MTAGKVVSCPVCGKFTDEAWFCGYCGARLEHGRVTETTVSGARPLDPPQSEESRTVVLETREYPKRGEAPLSRPTGDDESATLVPEAEVEADSLGHKVRATAGAGSAVESPEESLPSSLGRYRVVRLLGRGAMGTVYLARDDAIGRNVALKVLSLDPAFSSENKLELAERFAREARAAGALSHPNVVTVHDVGEENGIPYIAMEFIPGATLREIVSGGPLSVQQSEQILRQVGHTEAGA